MRILPPISSRALVVIAAALALVAPVSLPAQAQDSAHVPAVTAATARTAPLRQVVTVSGTLIPRNEVLVFPHTGGFAITELNAEMGDRVSAGDVLARIDDRTLRLRVTQAEAQLANAEAARRQAESQVAANEAQLQQADQVLTRMQSLRSSGAATQSALAEAQTAQLSAEAALASARDGVQAASAALEQARASLEVAQLDYRNAAIVAPVDGIVSARNGQIGAIAATGGEPIFRLIEDGEVEVSAEVIETELVLLERGQPARLQIAGLPEVTGAVRLVAPVVSATTRLGEVRISLGDSAGLRPGLFVSGQVIVADREGLAVPLTAVLRDSEGSYVLVLGDDNVLAHRDVSLGLAWDGLQEITDGLSAGERVVARAGAFFADGDRVRPLDADADPSDLAQAGSASEAQTGEDGVSE